MDKTLDSTNKIPVFTGNEFRQTPFENNLKKMEIFWRSFDTLQINEIPVKDQNNLEIIPKSFWEKSRK